MITRFARVRWPWGSSPADSNAWRRSTSAMRRPCAFVTRLERHNRSAAGPLL